MLSLARFQVLLILFGLSLPLSLPASAATRLGLHVTLEELYCWRQRAGIDSQGANGITCPVKYKIAGDVSTNSPGDWNRIVSYKTTFLSNPAAEQWDGTDLVLDGNGCVQNGSPAKTNQTGLGKNQRDAAFFLMVNPADAQAATLRSNIRTNLLVSANAARLNFANTALWCAASLGDAPAYVTAPWHLLMFYAYDYLKIYDQLNGLTTLSAGDKTILDAWFIGGARFWQAMSIKSEQEIFVNAPGGNFAFTSLSQSICNTNSVAGDSALIYDGGPAATQFHDNFNNRLIGEILAAGVMGVAYNDAPLIAYAKRRFQEWIGYGTDSDGIPWESVRGRPLTGQPSLGYLYAGQDVGPLVFLADTFARAGDTSLFTYTTTLTVHKAAGCQVLNTTTKSLLLVATTYMNYADHTILRYNPTFAGQVNYIIDPVNRISSELSVHYIYPAVGNHYWQSTYITDMYTHNSSGPYTPAFPVGDAAPNGWSTWSGSGGHYPAVLFMFGETEGLVNPYSLGTALSPPRNVRIVVP